MSVNVFGDGARSCWRIIGPWIRSCCECSVAGPRRARAAACRSTGKALHSFVWPAGLLWSCCETINNQRTAQFCHQRCRLAAFCHLPSCIRAPQLTWTMSNGPFMCSFAHADLFNIAGYEKVALHMMQAHSISIVHNLEERAQDHAQQAQHAQQQAQSLSQHAQMMQVGPTLPD
jgi:hypothetical protein